MLSAQGSDRLFAFVRRDRSLLGIRDEAALRLLSRYWRRSHIEEGAILRDRSGHPLSAPALYLMIRRRTNSVGIEQVTPHTFRRSCASRLLAQGVSENAVRVMLGWSRRSHMLARYTASRATERALEAQTRVRLLD